jgi:hypothetical protein
MRVPLESCRTRTRCLGSTLGRETLHHATPLAHLGFYNVIEAGPGGLELNRGRWSRYSPRHVLRVPTPFIFERVFGGHVPDEY